MDRRSFLVGAPVAAALAHTMFERAAMAQQYGGAQTRNAAPPATEHTVLLTGDTAPWTPQQYAAKLPALLEKHANAGDTYLAHGAVEELEQAFAKLLAKEDCAFFATGTLANNVAVRILCGDTKHALVQAESHFYADESDAASILSGLTLAPMAAGKVGPTADEIAAAIEEAAHRPYPMKIGAIALENPVRRQAGQAMPFDALQKITTLARSKGIGTHWDGARSMLLTGTPGFDLKATAALFDTVYVSLYKYLGAPFGAVLAGNKETITKARELRHIYGGLLYHGWVAALPALDALPGFQERFGAARVAANALFAKLEASGNYKMVPTPNPSNIYGFDVANKTKLNGLRERLLAKDIRANVMPDKGVTLSINESILRRPVDEIAAAFLA